MKKKHGGFLSGLVLVLVGIRIIIALGHACSAAATQQSASDTLSQVQTEIVTSCLKAGGIPQSYSCAYPDTFGLPPLPDGCAAQPFTSSNTQAGTIATATTVSATPDVRVTPADSWTILPLRAGSPAAIAVDSQDHLYTVDTYFNVVLQSWTAGDRSRGWLMHKPDSVATDRNGNVYISDFAADCVVKLAPGGALLAQWGSKGSGPGQFDGPKGIALDGLGNLYVADSQNSRIQKLSPTGVALQQWTTPGVPSAIAAAEDGTVYVVSGTERIMKLSSAGELTQWAGPGHSGALIPPKGLAVGRDGSVYFVDIANTNVLKFSPAGERLAAWPVVLREAAGIAVDSGGVLYVADTIENRVKRHSPTTP